MFQDTAKALKQICDPELERHLTHEDARAQLLRSGQNTIRSMLQVVFQLSDAKQATEDTESLKVPSLRVLNLRCNRS
eukprot:6457430-Amphidinium_carterae.1